MTEQNSFKDLRPIINRETKNKLNQGVTAAKSLIDVYTLKAFYSYFEVFVEFDIHGAERKHILERNMRRTGNHEKSRIRSS